MSWRRHLSVGGGSQKGGSGNRPSHVNNSYNYHLGVVYERSGVDCPIKTLGSTCASGCGGVPVHFQLLQFILDFSQLIRTLF